MSLQIYVLRLQSDKWYIGKTTDAMKRFQDHVNGNGSVWTAKYTPIKIEELTSGDEFDEDKITKKYMSKYGIDNVRGGSYVTLELSEEQRKYLRNEINMSTDKCALCGENGHFIKNCPKNNNIVAANEQTLSCERCKRVGHTADKCYAKTNMAGKFLGDKKAAASEVDVVPKVNTVKAVKTPKVVKTPKKEKTEVLPPIVENKSNEAMLCERCGRNNHLVEKCYTKKDIDGRTLVEKGNERVCERCKDTIYHNEQCECPMTSIKQLFSVIGDSFRVLNKEIEKDEKINKK